MNFDKMKVVDLRTELQARGLDTKGVKATLIDRLKEALELEQANGVAPVQIQHEPQPVDGTPMRRSSRSRTKSPEPVPVAIRAPDPVLPVVTEESENVDEQQQNYEKFIDETNADDDNGEMNEDELLADEPEDDAAAAVDAPVQESTATVSESTTQQPEPEATATTTADATPAAATATEEEKMETDGGENRGTKRRSDSPTKGNTPKKRQRLPPPNIDDFVNEEDEPELSETALALSWFDSDLNLKIDRESFCSAQSLSETGLALVWAGARSNYGVVNNGKYFYEVQLVSFNTKINYPHERNLHEIRCGWSTPIVNLQLGEQANSFGIDSSGKKCLNCTFEEYGPRLRVDDVVGIHLDLNDEKSTVSFSVNGKHYGVAFEFEKSSLDGEALFPHISTKNVEFRVNFGQLAESIWSTSRDKFKESELKRRSEDLERKKRDLGRKIDEKAKKETEAAEKAAAATAAAASAAESAAEQPAAEGESSESKAEEEKPAEEPAAQEQPNTSQAVTVEEKKETSLDDELAALPAEILQQDIDTEYPVNNCADGYIYTSKYPIEDLVKGPRRPDARTDCEVIMMIGVPGAGKSFWATKHAAENPEKRYTLLGTKYLLERMKIQGVARKPGSGPGRWEKLIELCNRGLLTLNEIACKRRRNFILDQPHVYISDQRRKMRVYGDFKRIAVIVVSSEEEYKKRFKQRLETEGKDIPEAAVNEMRANLTLPELEYQWFNEIIYSDLQQEEAQAEVNRENERGKKALSHRNRQNDFGRGGRDFNQRNNDRRGWGNNAGGRNDRNDFRRNDRWGPRNNQGPMGGNAGGSGGSGGGGGSGYQRRDFDFNRRRNNNWNRPDNNWNNNPRQGGYGGAPPPRPGKQRPNDNRQQQVGQHRNFRPNQGGHQGGNNNRNRDNRRSDGNKKFGNKDWNSQGNQWGSGNNWNNYGGNQGGYDQWNQNQQYGGNNADDQSQQNWMAFYQQQQQANSASWYSDQNYGGAFSSNTSYDSQTKQ